MYVHAHMYTFLHFVRNGILFYKLCSVILKNFLLYLGIKTSSLGIFVMEEFSNEST
jgi:hypothetical protein